MRTFASRVLCRDAKLSRMLGSREVIIKVDAGARDITSHLFNVRPSAHRIYIIGKLSGVDVETVLTLCGGSPFKMHLVAKVGRLYIGGCCGHVYAYIHGTCGYDTVARSVCGHYLIGIVAIKGTRVGKAKRGASGWSHKHLDKRAIAIYRHLVKSTERLTIGRKGGRCKVYGSTGHTFFCSRDGKGRHAVGGLKQASLREEDVVES